MTELTDSGTLIMTALAVALGVLFLKGLRDEWSAHRDRRNREHLRHIVGARPWWGGGR